MKEIARRGAARRADGRARRRLAAARRRRRCAGRDALGRRVEDAPASSRRSRSTPSTRTCSPTRRARPAGRRASLHVQGGFLVSIAREVAYQADAQPGDRDPLRHRHGLDHGPVDGGRRRRARRDDRLRRGRAGLAAPTGSGGCRAGARDDARRSRRRSIARADPARRARERTTSRRCARSCTTGEPWNPDPYRWLFEHVGGGRCPIINFSGGTEVGACFLSPTPASRSSRARSAARRSGWRWTSSTPRARSVRGEVGELVCRKPLPGMTRGVLARPRALPRDVLAAASRASGCTATGPRSTRTATGSCTAAPTTRSTSPASGSGRRSSSRRRSRTRGRRGGGGRRAARGEGRGRVDLLRRSSPARSRATSWRPRSRARSPASSARRSSRSGSSSCRRCRRRAARRSCAAPCARRRSAPTRATSRRSRTPRRWRRSHVSLPADRLDGQVALVTGGGRGIGARHRARARAPRRARRGRGAKRATQVDEVAREIGGLARRARRRRPRRRSSAPSRSRARARRRSTCSCANAGVGGRTTRLGERPGRVVARCSR